MGFINQFTTGVDGRCNDSYYSYGESKLKPTNLSRLAARFRGEHLPCIDDVHRCSHSSRHLKWGFRIAGG